ncbi:MAG: Flp family type IVb pilin [Pseudomonadota bacterium]
MIPRSFFPSAALKDAVIHFVDDERGETAIEYSLIIGLLFLAIVAGVRAYANETANMYDAIESAVIAR